MSGSDRGENKKWQTKAIYYTPHAFPGRKVAADHCQAYMNKMLR